MDSSDLRAFLAAHAITAELIHLPEHTPTVEIAAQALGVVVDQVAKSTLFRADGAPVLVIANGISRIDYRRLAEYLGQAAIIDPANAVGDHQDGCAIGPEEGRLGDLIYDHAQGLCGDLDRGRVFREVNEFGSDGVGGEEGAEVG